MKNNDKQPLPEKLSPKKVGKTVKHSVFIGFPIAVGLLCGQINVSIMKKDLEPMTVKAFEKLVKQRENSNNNEMNELLKTLIAAETDWTIIGELVTNLKQKQDKDLDESLDNLLALAHENAKKEDKDNKAFSRLFALIVAGGGSAMAGYTVGTKAGTSAESRLREHQQDAINRRRKQDGLEEIKESETNR